MTELVYVFRDGQRLTAPMLADLDRLDAAFFAEFRVHLILSSGVRLFTEQERVFFERYRPAGQIAGRRVFDWRWYRGVLYGRISPAGTVAAPDSPLANHVLENGTGAVDLRDSGHDAGILNPGSSRAQWMRADARRFNYFGEGYSFGEPWHWKYLGNPRGAGSAPTTTVKEGDEMYSIRVDKKHQFGVSAEFITHYGNPKQADITRRVTSGVDELHDLSAAQATALLDGLGIPRDVVQFAHGRVLNPQSGAFEPNGTWSRHREILANLDHKK